MKIGILQTGHAPDALIQKHGDYNDFFINLLADEMVEFSTYAVVDGVLPPAVTSADAWLITGSRFAVYEPHSWIGPLESLIRKIYQSRRPMVGICFGHQIIAQTLGGKVERNSGGWSVGPVEYQRHDYGGTQTLLAWHQDQIVTLPSDAEVIGTSACCAYAMLRYGDCVLTYQPHPEFTREFFTDLVEERRDILPPDVRQATASQFDAPFARAAVASEIARFLAKA